MDAVFAKFSQHKDILDILMRTQGSELVQQKNNDSYWQDGFEQNILGRTLMKVREKMASTWVDTKEDLVEEQSIDEEKENIQTQNLEDQNSVLDSIEDKLQGETEDSIPPMETFNPNHKMRDEQEDDDSEEEMEQVREYISSRARHTSAHKSSRGRVKRDVFLHEDGNSIFERNNEEKGTVTLVSEGTVISEKALPPLAKLVVHENQWRRKYQPTEADFPEDEEDDEDEDSSPSQGQKLVDYFQEETLDEEAPEYLLSAQSCIESSKNMLELLKDLPKDDLAFEGCLQTCRSMKEALEGFISQAQDEILMMELLQQFDNISQLITSES